MNPLNIGCIPLAAAYRGEQDSALAVDGHALMHRIGDLEAENLRLQELVAELLLKNRELRNNSMGA